MRDPRTTDRRWRAERADSAGHHTTFSNHPGPLRAPARLQPGALCGIAWGVCPQHGATLAVSGDLTRSFRVRVHEPVPVRNTYQPRVV
ncbi:hypothetical protein [Nonomuraea jabiensis]|uniref:hypothetical protein n=1 Tax=Nonomuraea jabiensis TaxID=882448 RepID=UPI003D75DC44